MGMGFQFKKHRLGLWDLSWDLKKKISREKGLGPPPLPPSRPPSPLHDPLHYRGRCRDSESLYSEVITTVNA